MQKKTANLHFLPAHYFQGKLMKMIDFCTVLFLQKSIVMPILSLITFTQIQVTQAVALPYTHGNLRTSYLPLIKSALCNVLKCNFKAEGMGWISKDWMVFNQKESKKH